MSREFFHRASLVLNVVLAATVVALILRDSEPAPAPPAGTDSEIDAGPARITSEAPASTRRQKSQQYTDIASASDRRRWIVDQLRAAGVPNTMLARVVISDLEEHFDRRIEECRGDAGALAVAQLEYDMGKDVELRAALGEEGFRLWDRENMLREANSGKIQLTALETDAIYGLKKTLQQRHWELEQARLKKTMDDAGISDASEKAYSEFNQQMKALLGDDRYAQSQGADPGAAAANLRLDLAKVNPSDSQFEELLKAQQQWNERRAELDRQFQDDPSSATYADQLKALEMARDQEYQRVLGTNAFGTLQKEQDGSYLKMKAYANLWTLDDHKIDYVYGAVKYYQKSVEDYKAQARAIEAQGQTVDWNALHRNLQQFAEQTRQALQSYLGPDRFNKMQRNGVFPFEALPQRGTSE